MRKLREALFKGTGLLPGLLLGAAIMTVALAAVLAIYYIKTPAASPLPRYWNPAGSRRNEQANVPSSPLYKPDGWLMLRASNTYSSGAYVSFAADAQPVLEVAGNDVVPEVTVSFYEATMADLLQFMTRDKDGKQLNALPSLEGKRLVGSQDVLVSGSNETFVTLPLGESGVLHVVARGHEILPAAPGTTVHQKGRELRRDIFVWRAKHGAFVTQERDTYLLWGQRFADGKSVGSGTATLYGTLNAVTTIAVSQARADGTFVLPRTSKADFAVVESEGSTALIPMNGRLEGDYWSYGAFSERVTTAQRTFLFTDRPLYRPGDEIFYKAVMRNDDDGAYSMPTGSAVVKLFRSGDEQPAQEKTVSVSADGTVSGTFALPADAPTGYYSVNVEHAGRGMGSTSFMVEHFRKPEYSIDAYSDRTEFVSGDKARVRVSGTYFSGQPLTGGKVTYSVRANNYYNYDYYSAQARDIGDYRWFDWGGEEVVSGETVLDDNGEAWFEVDTRQGRSPESDRVFTVTMQYDNGSGNPSLASRNFIVYRGDFSLYVDDRVAEAHAGVQVGATYSLPLVAVAHAGRAIPAGQAFTVKTHRELWVRDHELSTATWPRYKLDKEDLPERTVTLDAKGLATLTLDVQRAGSYTFRFETKDARGLNMTFVFGMWASAANQPAYSEAVQPLQFTFDKKIYLPGDTARIVVSSVIPDRDVLVTVQRDSVRRYFVVPVRGGNATFELPLTQADLPNLYLKATAFSRTQYESAYENLVLSTDNRKLQVTMTADRAKYGPGDTVALTVETKDDDGNPVSAEVAVWAVDKALFELVAERPLEIFDRFWSQRYSYISEAHSLMSVGSSGAEKGGCFVGDTAILMADGGTKPIASVQVGDTVLTHPEGAMGTLVEARVTDVRKHTVAGVLIVNGSLHVTPEHVLRVNDAWKTAGDLAMGDLLVGADGASVPVSSIEWQLGEVDVYNLTIENEHTFIAGGVWVHNEKGGGGGARSVFKDTAYWNPSVRTDASGRAVVRFTLPDNLTTWVTSAVGATVDTKVGKDRTEILVSKDVIVRPVLPNKLRVGDDMVLAALMQNFTDKPHTYVTSLAFDAGDARLTRAGTRTLEAGRTASEYWRVQPKIPSKAATLLYGLRAMDDSGQDNVQQSLPVEALVYRDSSTKMGTHEAGADLTLPLAVPSDTDRVTSKATLSLAPSVLGLLPHSLEYLIGYPYGCVEQTTSRFVPLVIAARSPSLFAATLKNHDAPALIGAGVKRLTELRNEDGGWGWWYGSSDPHVTLYVTEHLLLAREAGYDVPQHLLDGAKRYFESNAPNGEDASSVRDVDTARALQLLGASTALPITVDFTKLEIDKLATAVLTNVALGVNDPAKSGLTELLGRAQHVSDYVYWEAGHAARFGSRSASTAMAIRALMAAKADPALISAGVQYLALHRVGGYWENTYGTVQTMRALADYAVIAREEATNLTYVVTLDGKEVTRGKVTDFRATLPAIALPLTDATEASNVRVQVEGTGRLFSTLKLDAMRTDTAKARRSTPLKLSRTYANETRPGEPFRVGDTVRVTLGAHGLPKDGSHYLFFEDELPAGLVPINEAFLNEGGKGGSAYDGWYGDPYWYYGGSRNEITANGIQIPIPYVSGKYILTSYRARVVAEGSYLAPPAHVELMYSPWLNARTGFQRFVTGQFR